MSIPVVNGRFLHQRLAGVQRYGREILRGFDRAGYKYEVAEPGTAFLSGKISQHMWEQIMLPRKVKNNRVLWSPTNSGPIYADNHVITMHDIGIFPHPEWFSASYGLWKRTLVPRIIRQATKVLTVSHFSKQLICSYLNVDPEKIHVVYNGVDKERFRPAPRERVQQVITKYNIRRPYLLTLGSMDPRKNFTGLIKAWNACVKCGTVPGYELVIAGGYNSNFKRFDVSDSPASVRFLGYVDDDDLAPLYSAADGFLFPSLFEGFGLPVIEAMACGTPVLTSNTTALKEVAEGAAITVDPEHLNSIRDGIAELVESPQLRHSLVERGFKRAEQFDWDQSACKVYGHLTQ